MWGHCSEGSRDHRNQLPPELGEGPELNFTPILDYSGGSSSGIGTVIANTAANGNCREENQNKHS